MDVVGGVDYGMGGYLGVFVCFGYDCLRCYVSYVCGWRVYLRGFWSDSRMIKLKMFFDFW